MRKIQQFMKNRCGIDELNFLFLFISLASYIIYFFVTTVFLETNQIEIWICGVCILSIVLCIYRMFSKNLEWRRKENAVFLKCCSVFKIESDQPKEKNSISRGKDRRKGTKTKDMAEEPKEIQEVREDREEREKIQPVEQKKSEKEAGQEPQGELGQLRQQEQELYVFRSEHYNTKSEGNNGSNNSGNSSMKETETLEIKKKSSGLNIGLNDAKAKKKEREEQKRIEEERKAAEALVREQKKREQRQRQQKFDPNYVYFNCPYCNQAIRIPKRQGKVKITCPTCKNKFIKET